MIWAYTVLGSGLAFMIAMLVIALFNHVEGRFGTRAGVVVALLIVAVIALVVLT